MINNEGELRAPGREREKGRVCELTQKNPKKNAFRTSKSLASHFVPHSSTSSPFLHLPSSRRFLGKYSFFCLSLCRMRHTLVCTTLTREETSGRNIGSALNERGRFECLFSMLSLSVFVIIFSRHFGARFRRSPVLNFAPLFRHRFSFDARKGIRCRCDARKKGKEALSRHFFSLARKKLPRWRRRRRLVGRYPLSLLLLSLITTAAAAADYPFQKKSSKQNSPKKCSAPPPRSPSSASSPPPLRPRPPRTSPSSARASSWPARGSFARKFVRASARGPRRSRILRRRRPFVPLMRGETKDSFLGGRT